MNKNTNNIRPTFLGIGAHKAGTTWLYVQLKKHPEIWMPPIKELHYFDRSPQYPSPNFLSTASPFARLYGSKPWERPRMISGIKDVSKHIFKGDIEQAIWWCKWKFGNYNDKWYKQLFEQARLFDACGEITPSYSILESHDIKRIKEINPEMKIIFFIRNPIERAWSAIRSAIYNMHLNIGYNSCPQIISALNEPRMILRGNYERTLDVYLSHFSSSQILVCFFDAIKHNPLVLMQDITDFLNVKKLAPLAIDSNTLINSTPNYEIPHLVKEYLYEVYSPMINRISNLFGSYATTWNSLDSSPPKHFINSYSTLPTSFHP